MSSNLSESDNASSIMFSGTFEQIRRMFELASNGERSYSDEFEGRTGVLTGSENISEIKLAMEAAGFIFDEITYPYEQLSRDWHQSPTMMAIKGIVRAP